MKTFLKTLLFTLLLLPITLVAQNRINISARLYEDTKTLVIQQEIFFVNTSAVLLQNNLNLLNGLQKITIVDFILHQLKPEVALK